MVARLLRWRGLATFALLVVVAEIAGRSFTTRIDRLLHVEPFANSGTNYYPFMLVGVKVIGAFALALLLGRIARVRAGAETGERLLAALGHGDERRTPRLRPGLSPRIWLASFAATSCVYLIHVDAEGIAAGRWPLFSPWLHTYALPVFAVLSVGIAVIWRFTRWLDDVEGYAAQTFARIRRILTVALRAPGCSHGRPLDDASPRRRFGLAFESRPPPLSA
ncbi:MAG TPA: hypothetical protein VIJ70_12445 [Gaiellaceae bacterium]